MRVDTHSQVFVFRSVVDDEGAASPASPPSPAMAAAMAWSTPLPLYVPSTATSIRPVPLADLRLMTAYAHEPPQLRDASLVPPAPSSREASSSSAPRVKTAKASAFTKAAKAARSSSRPPAPARSRASALAHAVTFAAPYVAALVVFGVAQAKWAADAWTGMRESDAVHLLARAVAPDAPAAPIAATEAPMSEPAVEAAPTTPVVDVAVATDDAPAVVAAPTRATTRAPRPRTPTVTPGSAPRGSR